MAVIKVKPQKVVAFFLGIMERETLGTNFLTVLGQDLFKGAQNDTVTLRMPEVRAVARDYEWRTRTAPIVLDDIVEDQDGIDVKLDTHLYSATSLTDEQMTLDEIDFATEVLNPQAQAVIDRLESKIVAAFKAEPFADTISFGDAVDPYLVALEARRLLNSHKVAPRAGRTLMVGSDIAAAFLASNRLSQYTSTGDSGNAALRDAIIGRLAGVPVVENGALDPNEGYYVHKSALVLGNVAPVAPKGATASASANRGGYFARWIADYDPNYLRDRSIVSTFAGITGVRDERQLTGTHAGELLEVGDPNRGVRNVRGVKLSFTGTGSVLTP